MRILLVNGGAYPHIGGVENSLRFIGRELLLTGHEVKIFCFQFAPSEPLCIEHDGIEIVRCPYTPSRWPHTRIRYEVDLVRREIQPLLRDFRPDAIWSRSASLGLGVSMSGYQGLLSQIFCTTARMDCQGSYLRTSGMPLTRRLMLLGLWPLHYQEAYRIERKLLNKCQPVVFSEVMRRQLHDLYGNRAAKTRVIAPGVDTDIFCPKVAADSGARIEAEYGISSKDRYVLYVGRLSIAKNLPLLIDAVAKLRQSAKLILVGSGSDEGRLRAYVERRGLSSRIRFVGSQDKLLPGFYGLARVCVLPTTIESFGQVYLESMACGTPVVGLGGNGNRFTTATDEIVRDSETGRVISEASPTALAQAIDSILEFSPSEYDTMSKKGVEDVANRFSWRRFVDEMLIQPAMESSSHRA